MISQNTNGNIENVQVIILIVYKTHVEHDTNTRVYDKSPAVNSPMVILLTTTLPAYNLVKGELGTRPASTHAHAIA